MSGTIPNKPVGLSVGVFVVGRAVGDFQLRSGVSAKNGRPYQFVEGQVVAGTTFVKISETVEVGSAPYLPKDGDEVRASVVPDFKSNGILSVSAKVIRPDVVTPTK